MVIPSQSNNKRIAKNTLFLYFRMILIMFVSLFTSRVVLEQLGIQDFGIYNVVGGIVMMFAFINNSMASSTQRYLTFELGKGNTNRLSEVFTTALNIHISIGIIVIVLAETIGLWFLNYKLNIPTERMYAANWVYQFSILTFCINIIQVPYNACLIAHEKMSIYAYISILEAVLKLTIAYLISITEFDRLILYAILIFIVQFAIRSIYQVYCKYKFAESRYRLFFDKNLFKQMSEFAGWNLFGSLAWLMRDQGLNIILNLFFGPIVNAARGIAVQVSSSVMGFISNFQVAMNPQIIKSYATGNIKDMESLAFRGTKFSIIVLLFIAIPLCLNMDFILNIWLEEVPNYTSYFIILIMVDSLMSTLFGTPFMTSLAATGKIKKYQITVSTIIIMLIPISYIIFKLGFDAPAALYIMIFITLSSGVVRFIFCKRQIGFSLKHMLHDVILPLIKIIIPSLIIPISLKLYYFQQHNLLNFIILCIISIICMVSATFLGGLDKNEKLALINIIKSKIKK